MLQPHLHHPLPLRSQRSLAKHLQPPTRAVVAAAVPSSRALRPPRRTPTQQQHPTAQNPYLQPRARHCCRGSTRPRCWASQQPRQRQRCRTHRPSLPRHLLRQPAVAWLRPLPVQCGHRRWSAAAQTSRPRSLTAVPVSQSVRRRYQLPSAPLSRRRRWFLLPIRRVAAGLHPGRLEMICHAVRLHLRAGYLVAEQRSRRRRCAVDGSSYVSCLAIGERAAGWRAGWRRHRHGHHEQRESAQLRALPAPLPALPQCVVQAAAAAAVASAALAAEAGVALAVPPAAAAAGRPCSHPAATARTSACAPPHCRWRRRRGTPPRGRSPPALLGRASA